ncbi:MULTISPECIES: hypothetical protein [Vagococcus]|uniref:Uncharacterized protein n=1 Tax=Vagococcus fluvialis bH819 TaxID=1255619 RepID=A0A1X6WQN9_9ENTE|nr:MULTISPECIES: hypothetical protein [Vagococcus]SLM86643.1 hypothetical protein FM121_11150 [Vagococcus fluvialis bH819]HCM90851.1 hypothetical protein [Vagococcus sp.]
MSFKRFFQLFIFYIISILIPLFIIKQFAIHSFWLSATLIIVLGYIILTLPLTILTMKKSKKS